MRKETDLTAIKNILKDFLHMPVEKQSILQLLYNIQYLNLEFRMLTIK